MCREHLAAEGQQVTTGLTFSNNEPLLPGRERPPAVTRSWHRGNMPPQVLHVDFGVPSSNLSFGRVSYCSTVLRHASGIGHRADIAWAQTIGFRCSSIDIRFRLVRQSVSKRFACLVHTRTGFISTGGPTVFSGRILARYFLKIPFSAGTPSSINPNLGNSLKSLASVPGAATICVPRRPSVLPTTIAAGSPALT